MLLSEIDKIFDYLIILINSLISTLTYGSNIIKDRASCSMLLFNVSQVFSTFMLNIFTGIDNAVVSSPIAEITDYSHNIFSKLKSLNEESAMTNLIACLMIGTLIFGILSIIIGKIRITGFFKFLPTPVVMGVICSVGLCQFKVLENETWPFKFMIVCIAFCKFSLKKIFPEKEYLIFLFTFVFITIFHTISLRANLDRSKFYGENLVFSNTISSIKKEISFEKADFQAIFSVFTDVLKMSVSCLIHLPVGLLSFVSHTGIKADLNQEMITQGLVNICCVPTIFPCYFSYTFSVMANRKLSKKFEGFIVGILLSFIMLIVGAVYNNIPRFYLKSFTILIGINTSFFALFESFKNACTFEYIVMLLVSLTGFFMSSISAFLIGITFCLCFNLFLYIKSFEIDTDLNLKLRKILLNPVLLKNNIDYFCINHLMFFGCINTMNDGFYSLKSKIAVIDLMNCYSFDMLSNSVLQDLINRKKQTFVVIGRPKFFKVIKNNNLIVADEYKEASKIIVSLVSCS